MLQKGDGKKTQHRIPGAFYVTGYTSLITLKNKKKNNKKVGVIDFEAASLLFWLKVSVLPVTSAAISPSALMTFTCTTPTSFRFWKDLHMLWKGWGWGVQKGCELAQKRKSGQ